MFEKIASYFEKEIKPSGLELFELISLYVKENPLLSALIIIGLFATPIRTISAIVLYNILFGSGK